MSKMTDQEADRLANMPEKTIGERIKRARSAKRLRQEQLAAEIGKVRPTIVQYEAGKILPPIDVLELIAMALGTSPAYLAFGLKNESGSARDHVSIPVGIGTDQHPDLVGNIILPIRTVADLGWPYQSLHAVKLEIGAVNLGLTAGDLLIIDKGSSEICADGRVYAFVSAGGVMVMRSEALPEGCNDAIVLTGPLGQTLKPSKAPKTIGRVVGLLHTVHGL